MNTPNNQPFDVWADTVAQNDAKKILEVMDPLLDWLAEFHNQGKGHGNIQPGTLLVSSHNHIDQVYLAAATAGIMVKSSGYAPPEAYEAPLLAPSIRCDVYSIAAVLYRAISAQSPVPANVRKVRKSYTLPMDNVSVTIADGLSKALDLQPDARPANLKALRDLLQHPETAVPRSLGVTREKLEHKYKGCIIPASHPVAINAQPAFRSKPGTSKEIADSSLTTPSGPTPTTAKQLTEKAVLPATTQSPTTQTIEQQPREKAVSPVAVPLPTAPTIAKRLPINLTVGRQVEIPIGKLISDSGVWQIRFLNADALGLPFDDLRKALVGTPTVSGEHHLNIELTHPEAQGRPPLNQSIAVTINPDPDSLWKNLPSDEKDPYFKPDTDHLETATPYAWIFAASQRGRSHAHEGLFRDDDFRLRFDKSSEWHLLAAADGAGSAKYSRRGSQIACEHALEFMAQWLVEQQTILDAAVQAFVGKSEDHLLRSASYSWLGGAAFEARKAIQLEAEKRDPPAALRDYHTTLLLAVTKLTPAGWVIASFSIGDGGIALRHVNGEPKSLCTPDSGEYGGQTVFLTASNVLSNADHIMQRIHTAIEPNLSALALMTDGVTDPKFPTEVSLGDAAVWKVFWDELNSAVNFKSDNKDISAQLLKWLSFRSPGNHDDRTIVILMPKTGSENAPSHLENARAAKG